MARNSSHQESRPPADARLRQSDGNWHAGRLLSRSNAGFYMFTDRLGYLSRWLAGERWVRRLAIFIASLLVIFTGCFGGLWWRLGAGPINLDMATPWLAAAIED